MGESQCVVLFDGGVCCVVELLLAYVYSLLAQADKVQASSGEQKLCHMDAAARQLQKCFGIVASDRYGERWHMVWHEMWHGCAWNVWHEV